VPVSVEQHQQHQFALRSLHGSRHSHSLLPSLLSFVYFNIILQPHLRSPIEPLLLLATMYTKSILMAALAGLALAGPVEVRQIGGTGSSSNEFSRGGCKDILFAWARGSGEVGNMVCNSLELATMILTAIREPSSDPQLPTVSSEPSDVTRSPPRALPTPPPSAPTPFPAVPTPGPRTS
jgi:hypothetical protein